jgi:hypothetical protein
VSTPASDGRALVHLDALIADHPDVLEEIPHLREQICECYERGQTMNGNVCLKYRLVAHDASGPPAIDWALDNADQIAAFVLLNTYYCERPTLRAPEAIRLFSTPVVRNAARFISSLFHYWIFRRMYA